jgi:hypothetical protein
MKMKKYLITGIAALALCVGFTSCSKDLEQLSQEEINQLEAQKIVDKYKKAFKAYIGGEVSPTQTWGFGSPTGASTRSQTVNGDTYDKFPSSSDVASYFPTAIPEDAVEVSDLESYVNTVLKDENGNDVYLYGQPLTMYNLEWVYKYMVTEGFNLKITEPGTYDVGCYMNHGWENGKDTYHYFNLYIMIDEDEEDKTVVINRPQDSHFNIYIISGDVEMGPTQASEFSTEVISVGTDATFTDPRDHIAANGSVSLYNRGVVYATNVKKYDIGNYCKIYNEGRFDVTGPLTYSPQDAEHSYFMNLGDDALLTAPSMTLNSSGNFFNSGTTIIEGETLVTNDEIYWVNAGHYTTGTMTFSAQNATFYNYCQLIVEGNAHMYDGEFNLMTNSYTEVGSATMDNFAVNMGSNTGMNILGDFTMDIGQQDRTFQGFRTTGTHDFLRVGGTMTVAEHMLTFQLSGDITYAINNIVDLGANNSGVQPTFRFNDGTTQATLEELNVTANETGCGSTWTIPGPGPDPDPDAWFVRVMAEDLSADEASDFDFNDVVIDVYYIQGKTNATIVLQAAGGTLPLRIAGNDDWEVHELFQVPVTTMVNTNWSGSNSADRDPVTLTLTNFGPYETEDAFLIGVRDDITLEVKKTLSTGTAQWFPMTANQGEPAAKFAVDGKYQWLDERTNIKAQNGSFVDWVTGKIGELEWY